MKYATDIDCIFLKLKLQVLLKQPVSLSCDVFSYGMVLYEILAHYLPFAGIIEVRVAGMIVDGEVLLITVYYVNYARI